MRTKINLMMMVFLMLVFPAFAQTGGRITVSGRVLDEQGLPVIGAGVMQEGTTTGAATDMNGHYSLTVPSDAVLTVQCIGYQTAKIPVQGRSRIDIALTSDQEMLEETRPISPAPWSRWVKRPSTDVRTRTWRRCSRAAWRT